MTEIDRFKKKIASKQNYCQKRIYSVGTKAIVCILVGYCPDTLAYFQAIYEEAKKSFPYLDSADVTCSKVKRSSSVNCFTVIIFPVSNEKVEGWEYYNSYLDFGY